MIPIEEEPKTEVVEGETDASEQETPVVEPEGTPEISVPTPVEHVDPPVEKTVYSSGDMFDATKADNSVTFKLNQPPLFRVFSGEEHGTSWKDVADEFAKSNTNKIVGIEYL